MQALILAAGTGSRLGKYTENNTKCMLEINGETLITQALKKLNNAGITKLILIHEKNVRVFAVGNRKLSFDVPASHIDINGNEMTITTLKKN